MKFLLTKGPKPPVTTKPKSEPKPKIKLKKKVPLKTKLRIAATAGVIATGLITGAIAKKNVNGFYKNELTKTANHLSIPAYPQGKEQIIKSNIFKLNERSKPGEIYFWDSKDKKVSRIIIDPIKMRNIFRILEYNEQVKEIEKILQDAGGQVWDKYFLSKPIWEIYKDLTPSQAQKLEKIVKQLPTPELQYIQRESNMFGTIVGANAGAIAGIFLAVLLAKIKIRNKRRG